MRRISLMVAVVAVLVAVAPAQARTLLRLNGIGPLSLGMKKTDAVATGWLRHTGHGCPLGGTPYPQDFAFTGMSAPAGIAGTAEFDGRTARLTNLSFSKGVRTATGVVVGTTTATGMVRRYRSAGFAASAHYDSVFRATFVQIRRHRGGKIVMMGLATKAKVETIGVPVIPVCE